MMVLLMNQGAFGPLIIDEPEQYLDVKSITGMLIPRMRKLKTQQQIICVTKDEHILVSGDAEQVIATQSEKKLAVITGDINNKEIQEQMPDGPEKQQLLDRMERERRDYANIIMGHQLRDPKADPLTAMAMGMMSPTSATPEK